MNHIENTYETRMLLMDNRDSIPHYPEYHIRVKHVTIATQSNSTRIINITLLILYKKINTEPKISRSSKILKIICNQETFICCREYDIYLTTTIKNNEASLAWCGFILLLFKIQKCKISMESQFGYSYIPNGGHDGLESCNTNIPTYLGI